MSKEDCRLLCGANTSQSSCVYVTAPDDGDAHVQGVGGSVQYPRGFMQKAYELVRERGGLCIADEVQTGFGRCGSHYWGFQNHDVIPDIGEFLYEPN